MHIGVILSITQFGKWSQVLVVNLYSLDSGLEGNLRDHFT